MTDLYARLRSRVVLHSAWAKVKKSGLRSESSTTRDETRTFNANWLNNLYKLQTELRERNFLFTGERGIAPPKGKGKEGLRPLVIAPIRNRVVRRCLLDVLQGYGHPLGPSRSFWPGVPGIRAIMQTPTSIGGIPERGVPHGLALIDAAIRTGKIFFARSDIQNFFTCIPKGDVAEFMRRHVSDLEFLDLFERALETNLINQDELEDRRLFQLFPDPEVGVAQGSALSALAGNIALRGFDQKMNGRGIACIRYIDDFILLGESLAKVQAAYDSAGSMLKNMGMDLYDLRDSKSGPTGKAHCGNIFGGTEFLGYKISGKSRQPAQAATKKLLRKIDEVLERSTRDIAQLAAGETLNDPLAYGEAIVEVNRIIWGWSQAFRPTTARHIFSNLDREIDLRLSKFERFSSNVPEARDPSLRRRVLGIHLLQDTDSPALPDMGFAA